MSDAPRIEGERTTSSVAAKGARFTRKQKGVIFLVGGLVLFGWFIWAQRPKPVTQTDFTPPTRMGQPTSMPYPAPAPLPEPAAFHLPASPTPPPLIPQPVQMQVQRQAPQPRKLMVYGGSAPATQPVAAQGMPSMPGSPDGTGGALAASLKPTVLEGSTAAMLPHPELVVAQGTQIPCVMQTALDSQLPGFATCEIPYDVMGNGGGPATGTIKLLDAGTQVFGEVHGGENVRPGQDRVFVLWTRARTPHGVVISLASPAADSLGRSGVQGEVNNHWLARFGDALMFTLLDSATQIASAQLQNGRGTSLNLNSATNPATQTLQQSANIPPTITIRQGETIGIMTARDLDFSGIYGLSMANRR